MSRQQTAPAQSEKEFQAAVVEALKYAGFLTYHTYDSRRSQPGFPDVVAVRAARRGQNVQEQGRVLFIELKSEDGQLSDAQTVWFAALSVAGAEVYVWRPSDWPEIERTLARRSR